MVTNKICAINCLKFYCCSNLLSSVRAPLIIKFVVFIFCLCVEYMKYESKWMTMNRGSKKKKNAVNERKKCDTNPTKSPHNFYPVENCCYLYVQHFVKIFTFILDKYHIFFVKFDISFLFLSYFRIVSAVRIYSFQNFPNLRYSSWFCVGGFSSFSSSFIKKICESSWWNYILFV